MPSYYVQAVTNEQIIQWFLHIKILALFANEAGHRLGQTL